MYSFFCNTLMFGIHYSRLVNRAINHLISCRKRNWNGVKNMKQPPSKAIAVTIISRTIVELKCHFEFLYREHRKVRTNIAV